jgi:hypothetical protein
MNIYEEARAFFSNNKKPDQQELVPDETGVSFVEPNTAGAISVTEGGRFGQYLDFDVDTTNEVDLISRWRDISRMPEVSDAIDEIVNEFVSIDNEGNIVTLDLDDVEFSDGIKKKISDEFENILEVMNFASNSSELIRRWYIDGRIYFHKVLDVKTMKKDGILELRYINPVTIKKVIESKKIKNQDGIEVIKVTKEYYVYDPSKKMMAVNISVKSPSAYTYQQPRMTQKLMISPDAIAYAPSGSYDEDFSTVLSYLHTSLKVANQLRIMEDALIIMRIARAPQRRIFYVDVGNLGKAKAEQYVRDMMTKFKNQVTYDSMTGEVKDARRTLNMLEDFWIPRRDGKTTEVTTLEGDQNLGQLDDVNMFKQKLMASLKVPMSRFASDQQPGFVGLGRTSEITRDEIRFQKFVDKLRNKFSVLFTDILGTQCKVKGIVTDEDWKTISKVLAYKWARDSFFAELKEAEVLRERINTLTLVDPFVGKYISPEKMLKDVMRYNEEEMKEALELYKTWQEQQAALMAPPSAPQGA